LFIADRHGSLAERNLCIRKITGVVRAAAVDGRNSHRARGHLRRQNAGPSPPGRSDLGLASLMVNVRPPRMNQLVVVEINLLMERFQIVFVLQFDGLFA
jgi:hypothetical protein